MLASSLKDVFDANKLQTAQPSFNYKGQFQGGNAVNAAFAIEAMKRNIVRCVSFQLGGLDTHNGNYKDQPMIQQELFDIIAALVRQLDATPHPNKMSDKLSDHTHIMVVSEFCRTPQINTAEGATTTRTTRHIVISPRFQGEHHLRQERSRAAPAVRRKKFIDGERAFSARHPRPRSSARSASIPGPICATAKWCPSSCEPSMRGSVTRLAILAAVAATSCSSPAGTIPVTNGESAALLHLRSLAWKGDATSVGKAVTVAELDCRLRCSATPACRGRRCGRGQRQIDQDVDIFGRDSVGRWTRNVDRGRR